MKVTDNQYISRNFIEHEIHYEFAYGAKGVKRNKKKKATPLQIAKQNHWNKVKNCRRTIQQNFRSGDLWITFAYKKGTRKSMEDFEKDIRRFQNALRIEYKLRGKELKWIRRLEIGKRGGLHAHFIINNIGDTQVISETWRKTVKDSGRAHFENIDESDGFNGLAEYICKEPTEEIQGQMCFLIPGQKKKLCSISTSRNLKRPEAVKKRMNAWAIRHLLTGQQSIKATEGFQIDKNSIRAGVNKYTGLPYIRYREERIKKAEPKKETLLSKAKGLLGGLKSGHRKYISLHKH